MNDKIDVLAFLDRETRRFNPEHAESARQARAAIAELIEKANAALATAKPTHREFYRQGEGCTELCEVTVWPEWATDLRAALACVGGA